MHRSYRNVLIGIATLSLFACKNTNETTGLASAGITSSDDQVSFYCEDNTVVSTDTGKVAVEESAMITIKDDDIKIEYKYKQEHVNTGYSSSGGQLVEMKINSVFDFNRVSKEYVYTVNNPSTLKTIFEGESTGDQPIGLSILSISEGKFSLKQDGGSLLLELPNCK